MELERKPVPDPPPLAHYQLMMIDVPLLFADRRYQRGMKKTKVKQLVDNWDWQKYHPITIARRPDGRYALISGQQRTLAANELGIKQLPAVCIMHQSLQEEAKSYLGSGEVANITAGERFKARLVANEAKAFEIWGVVEKAGFSLRCMRDDQGGGSDPYCINGVFALETVFDTGYLQRTLDVIRESWGSAPVPDMTAANMIRGVYLAIRYLENHHVTDEALISSLENIEIKEVLDKGYERYRSMVSGRSLDAGVAAILVDQYNYRRRDPVPVFTKKGMRSVASAAGGRAAMAGGRAAEGAKGAVRAPSGRFATGARRGRPPSK